jgi:hypothetical protein
VRHIIRSNPPDRPEPFASLSASNLQQNPTASLISGRAQTNARSNARSNAQANQKIFLMLEPRRLTPLPTFLPAHTVAFPPPWPRCLAPLPKCLPACFISLPLLLK